MKRLLLGAILIATAAQAGEPVPSLPAAIAQALRNQQTPGAEIAIVKDGRVILDRGYGVRNTTTNAPVDTETGFEIGSVTKQFTAAAILQLREQGQLSLDDRLSKYIPEYTAAAGVTIRELLWQTSGIPEFNNTSGFARFARTHRGSALAAIALVQGKPLAFKPGAKWQYSNTNYVILGRIVEIVARMPWERYVRDHLFTPAGMTHSTFNDHKGGIDMARGYTTNEDGHVIPAAPLGNWELGAGAIVSTAGDLARWDHSFFGGRIIDIDDVKLATSPGRLSDGTLTKYGFGWGVDHYDGALRIAHNGATPGFSAMNATFPGLGERIIVLDNNWDADADAVTYAVFAALNPVLAARENVPAPGENPAITRRIETIWWSFRTGTLDRSQLTSAFSRRLSPRMVDLARANFARLHAGPPLRWIYKGEMHGEPGSTTYKYRVLFKHNLVVNIFLSVTSDGKISNYFGFLG